MDGKKKMPRIPPGFQELLESLSYDVLRAQPDDILRFCIDNLSNRLSILQDEGTKKADFTDNDNSLPITQSDAPSLRKARERRGGVAAESWDPENVDNTEKVVYPKTEEQKSSLLDAVRQILLFRCLDEDDRLDVVDAMFQRTVEPEEDVITYGEMGDNFYIIESGTYDIYVNIDNEMKKVTQYVDKGSFGELALMYNTPRAATIRAVTPGVLWAMSRETFRSIVLTKAFKKRKLYESLLESVDLLKPLSQYERNNLADALYTRIVEKGESIFLQGDVGQEMFFIESGSVVVRMTTPEKPDEYTELCTLGQYQYFGELALLTKNPRAASVYALERTRLAVLEVDSFERILGPCQDLLKQKAQEYAETLDKLTAENRI
ncbi:cAMP-dependent protein kinase type II regulatory subunit [Clonorchis sinensis]|uniref:cAMP-dependent protein kinase type II regulatory subunit n=2 Tax=Clonorchis sinensis TaxID=79923 RepID=A0A8T1MMA5_CLOSI|nr:cAMP-dependent protein kinase type II regulatory subunit [Clonorchis sinensis]GAA30981.2 cAMP-dependent protein kinase regulator [Clonorchis sinensis]